MLEDEKITCKNWKVNCLIWKIPVSEYSLETHSGLECISSYSVSDISMQP